MKRIVLLMGLAIFCLCPNVSTYAAISNASPVLGKNLTENTTVKKSRKAEKKLAKFEKKFAKKNKRMKKKGKFRKTIGLNFVGLTVLGIGGLFIWAGLAIPFVGWLFVGIGAIVGLVGFLLLFLLGGISVSLN